MSMRSRFVAYLTLPHFTPLVAVVVVTGLLAWVIDGSSLTGLELTRLVLAMLGGQLLVGVANELVDVEDDRLSKPSKPIPSGLVSRRGAFLMGTAGLMLMLIAGSSFGLLSFSLLLIGTGTGFAYSLWFKRSTFAWLPYLVALPLVPIWVAVSLDRFEPALLWLFPLGALAVLGVQLAQSLPDIEADRSAGIDSVTTRLGESRALWLCLGSLIGSLVLALMVTGVRDGWHWPIELAALVVIALVGTVLALYRWNQRIGVMAAFPCAAASAAMLGIAWVASIYR
jgi:4-hydroxybenzoate polyprenyltransferase